MGALRMIMHQGEIQSRIRLDTLPNQDLFGLGAADSLSGELMVVSGKIYQSQVENGNLQVLQNPQAEATLLVYAKVPAWDTLEIKGLMQLQDLLQQQSHGRSLEQPFPFLIQGRLEEVKYHVLNFDVDKNDLMNHKEGALTGTMTQKWSTLLGFYATDAKGIYTHHDSNVHIHVLSEDQTIMGHVDHLVIGKGPIKLLIPKS